MISHFTYNVHVMCKRRPKVVQIVAPEEEWGHKSGSNFCKGKFREGEIKLTTEGS